MNDPYVEIKFMKNGYMVLYQDFSKNNGTYVYKATEEFKLLEDLGKKLIGKNVEVKER